MRKKILIRSYIPNSPQEIVDVLVAIYCNHMLEPNDPVTRLLIKEQMLSFLNDRPDVIFANVVSDESNNSPRDVANNDLRVDFYIKLNSDVVVQGIININEARWNSY